MIDINTIQLPKSWSDITLGQMLALEAIANNQSLNEMEQGIMLIATLSNTDQSIIKEIPFSDFNKLSEQLNFLNDTPQKRIAKELLLNGREYTIDYDVTHMTTAQYIDFTEYMKDRQNKLYELHSIFVIPKDHKYNDGYDMQQVLDDIDNIPVDVAGGLSDFFTALFSSMSTSVIKAEMRELRKTKMDREQKNKMMNQLKHLLKTQEQYGLPTSKQS